MSVGIRTFEELVAAMRARRRSLGLSQLQVDEIAGLPIGYTGKIEAWLTNPNARNARALGRDSLPLLLGALKMSLSANASGKEASEKSNSANALRPRDEKNCLRLRCERMRLMRSIKVPAWKRRSIARKAAQARWEKH